MFKFVILLCSGEPNETRLGNSSIIWFLRRFQFQGCNQGFASKERKTDSILENAHLI